MSAATIPPRPVRRHPPSNDQVVTDAPRIPPRPTTRRPERSPSPHRDTFARSPLNGTPYTKPQNTDEPSYKQQLSFSDTNLRRPPSVSLPSIGQEGFEYASLDASLDNGTNGEQDPQPFSQQRNVAGDLPLHAPKASLAPSTATSRIAAVTRTDSSQAAAVGIGKPPTELDSQEREPRASAPQSSHDRSASSASRQQAYSSTRPESIHDTEHDHGIPAIGLQVPMYPNAGDVQAPSPQPFGQHSTGVGFFNDSSVGGYGGRRRSQAHTGPPGSYGLHGHGSVPRDALQRAWYEKHPEALEREGEYSSALLGNRAECVLSSEDLNKLVRQTSNRGIGFGTSNDVIGTPSEQIGYMASEEYSSRIVSPRPPSAQNVKKRSDSDREHAPSPLRKSFSLEGEHAATLRAQNEHAMESESDNEVIHVYPPARRHDKYGGGGYDPPTEDLGPLGGNTAEGGGWIDERGLGTPILASDEIAKNLGGEYMQPAISPPQERQGSGYFPGTDSEAHSPYHTGHGTHSLSNSRPSSRPASIHGFSGLSRFISREDLEGTHTPLEDVEEYEPLFEDEEVEEKGSKENRPFTAVDRLKRPMLAQHRFPSQDIWEDTPNSLQLQTTVDSPQLQHEDTSPTMVKGSKVFEPPELEQARKGEPTEEERTSFLDEHIAKSRFKPYLREETGGRPDMPQRFPSRDIWEDTPDSLRLETTVDSPQADQIITSPEETHNAIRAFADAQEKAGNTGKPIIPPRPGKPKGAEERAAAPDMLEGPARRQGPVAAAEVASSPIESGYAKESLPAERKAPTIPDRPKPQIPPRPAKAFQSQADENQVLSKTISAGSAGSTGSDIAPAPGLAQPQKTKPPVPSRPEGKLAALKAGFMNDLNSRLKLGPQMPKAQERSVEVEAAEQQEKVPLSDARKSRARGPQRRRPATETADTREVGATKKEGVTSWEIKRAWTVWSMSLDGNIEVSTPLALHTSSDLAITPVANTDQISTPSSGTAANDPTKYAPRANIVSSKEELVSGTDMKPQEPKPEILDSNSSVQPSVPSQAASHEPVAAQSPTIKANSVPGNQPSDADPALAPTEEMPGAFPTPQAAFTTEPETSAAFGAEQTLNPGVVAAEIAAPAETGAHPAFATTDPAEDVLRSGAETQQATYGDAAGGDGIVAEAAAADVAPAGEDNDTGKIGAQ